MALNGPIIIIEDDYHDAEVIVAAIKDLGIPNETKIMNSAEQAYDYLCTTEDQPYLILCDIRMPRTNGLSFRRQIIENNYLCKKSIPFIFLSGAVSEEIVNTAYEMNVQGFYQKTHIYEELKDQLLAIFIYWKHCLHPNQKVRVL